MGRASSLRAGQRRQAQVAGRRPGLAPRPSRWEEEFPLTRAMTDDGGLEAGVLPGAELAGLYRHMLLGRELDSRMVALQRQGRIGFYVGALGEEAAIAGSVAGMEERDWLFPCYREHLAAIMRGMPLAALVANLLGSAADLAKGRQMPCHEVWREGRFTSISSPLATQLPHAVGAACAARLRGDDVVALTWFGEGATSASDFHAALNFAGTRRAPVVFACRNNGWAISTPLEAQTAAETIAQKAVAYGIRGERVDGNDVLAVRDATRRARARAAAGAGPTLLELVTYRMGPHTTSDDPRAYRSDELLRPWREKDPLARLGLVLERHGLLDEATRARLLGEVREEIRAAVEEAEREPPAPELATLFEDVYAAPLRQQREQLAEVMGRSSSSCP